MKTEKILLEKDVLVPIPEKMDVYKVEGIPTRYFLSENSVRKNLATHKTCEECGDTIKVRSFCRKCSEKKQNENYSKSKFLEWDGKTPLVIYNSDDYFFDEDSLIDYIEENETEDLRLMICTSNYCPNIDEDYFSDEMPENYDTLSDFDKVLVEKLKEINKYISSLKPMSWSQGRFRTEYKR